MTATFAEIESIEALDFDYQPPCDMGEPCHLAAEWKAQTSCCGRVILCCQSHRDEVISWEDLRDLVCGARDIKLWWERI